METTNLDISIPNIDLDFSGVEGLDLDLSGFDLGDISSDRGENRYVLPKFHRPVASHAVKYDHAEDLARDIGPAIVRGERVDALLSGNFIYGDFLEALFVSQNLIADDVTISTLSLSQDNVDSLANLIDGDYVRSLNIIVSDYWWSHNRQNAPYIYKTLDRDDKFQLAVAGVHTKITLIRLGEQKLVIHGSANFRSSRSLEVFTAETNHGLYDFHMDWKRTVLNERGTVQKAIRAQKLFDLITRKTEGKKSWQAG